MPGSAWLLLRVRDAQVNMVAAEMKNTSRDLPRAIHTAEPTVIGCYVLINIAYYVLVPWDVLGKTNSIAVVRVDPLFPLFCLSKSVQT